PFHPHPTASVLRVARQPAPEPLPQRPGTLSPLDFPAPISGDDGGSGGVRRKSHPGDCLEIAQEELGSHGRGGRLTSSWIRNGGLLKRNRQALPQVFPELRFA